MGVQTEKLNIEREVKQLRQSTALPNKRESIVDKRLQELRVTLESELAKSKTYSVAVEETLSEAVSDLEAKTLENLNLKADLENALKESDLKSANLADIENECAALVSSYLLRH